MQKALKSLSDWKAWARDTLGQNQEDPDFDVEGREIDQLLCLVLECSRTELFFQSELNPTQQKHFEQLVERRASGEPIAYIVGSVGFYNIELEVNRDVLVPRPETELLVSKALEWFSPELQSFRLIDVATGSGAVLLAVVDELRSRFGEEYISRGTFLGTDISAAAIEVAKGNALRNDLKGHIEWCVTDLLDGIPPSSEPQLIVSNPPYIAEDEELPQSVSQFEPEIALRAGSDGLRLIERLLREIEELNRAKTLVLCEIGAEQRSGIESCVSLTTGCVPRFYRDLLGRDRVFETVFERDFIARDSFN